MHSFLAPTRDAVRLFSLQAWASNTLRTNNHSGAKSTPNTPNNNQENS